MTVAGNPSLSRARRLVFSTLVALFVFAVFELAAYVGLRVVFGDLDVTRYAAGRVDVGETAVEAQTAGSAGEVLHPYIGYVKYQAFEDLFAALSGPKPSDEIWVLVVGGSVAAGLNRGHRLQQALQTKAGEGKRLRLFLGARGGYKQPQQLLLLNYLLALATPIDLVINVDGFNEVALPWRDNGRYGVNPFYPRSWAQRIALRSGGFDPLKVGKIAVLRERQRNLAQWIVDNPLGKLSTAQLITALIYNNAEQRIMRLQDDLSAADGKQSDLSLEQRGTIRATWTSEEVLNESAQLWARASLLLAKQLEDQGVEYYQFLQPNQYLEGSKPLSAEEKAHYYRPDIEGYGQYARSGYPLLLKAATDHELAMFHYFDATDLFAEERATVYSDACCHFNNYGNRVLVEFIADKVVANSPRLGSGGG